MFRTVLLTLAVLTPAWVHANTTAPITPAPTTSQPVAGGYSPIALTPDLESLLYTTLGNEGLYASSVSDRLCVSSISKAEIQTVAGFNYRFTTTACDVKATLAQQATQQQSIAKYLGQCTTDFAQKCVKVDATITIYKRWDGVVQVYEIVRTAVPPTPTPTTTPLPPGSYSPIPLTPELSTMLYTTLANPALYSSRVTARVCVKSISLVETQIVAGRNYRFTTIACDLRQTFQQQQTIDKYLGQCESGLAATCVEVDASIIIYKKLDDSLQVLSLETTPRSTTRPKPSC